jgi:hypothetical protein
MSDNSSSSGISGLAAAVVEDDAQGWEIVVIRQHSSVIERECSLQEQGFG